MKLSCIFFGTILILILLITILPFKIPEIEVMESRLAATENIPLTQSKKLNEDTSLGKRPKNVLLVAYWRTGSTYFGQLLGYLVSKTYYNYEPLHTFSNLVRNLLKMSSYSNCSM